MLLVTFTSCPESYISRSGDFHGDDRQADRLTDRQTDRQIDKQITLPLCMSAE